MPDNSTTVDPAEIQPSDSSPPVNPAPVNEPGTTNDSATPSLFEKIRASAAGVIEKHGVSFKRGPGRPRKDGQPKKSDLALNVPVTAVPVAATPMPQLPGQSQDSSLLSKKSLTVIIKSATVTADKSLFRQLKMAWPDDPVFCQELVRETSTTKDEAESIAELFDVVCVQLGIDSKYIPTAAGVVAIGAVVHRYVSGFRIAREKIERDAKTAAPQPAKP